MNAAEQFARATRGISLKLQEEERERRMENDPEKLEVDTHYIAVDPGTRSVLKELGMNRPLNITTTSDAREILQDSSSGKDLHSEYQIV